MQVQRRSQRRCTHLFRRPHDDVMIDDHVSLILFGTIQTFVICVISIAYVGRYVGLGTVIERLLNGYCGYKNIMLVLIG